MTVESAATTGRPPDGTVAVSSTAIAHRVVTATDGVRRGGRHPEWMLNQLPVGLLESEFFVRFVSIFQQVGGTLMEDADNVDHLLDVSVAPDALVRWLGSWIGADAIDPSLADALQRRIVMSSARTLAWRGTKRGLILFLQLVSGGDVEVNDGGGVWRDGEGPDDTAWVQLRVESTGWVHDDEFIELVRDQLPAHVRADLFVGERRIWSSNDEGIR